ncbi:ATP phosphoribosyltransferase 1, chloroplastic [Sesamum angolense]|uniref:ATP phosphoribosyltransferase n=1 Tax=Sesamum angolense TaxID=2727404 RepID=A0AAE1X557_9LAMI|nr:ATP phosphoribosyltransferase 1, chloroplastic [Sesamum angolense]
MSVVRTIFLQCGPSVFTFLDFVLFNQFQFGFREIHRFLLLVASPATVVIGNVDKKPSDRNEVRLGLPSKGRMLPTLLIFLRFSDFVSFCSGVGAKGLSIVGEAGESTPISNLEVWFQRPKDVVRKLVSGDLDLGIVGLDTVKEYGQENEDLIIVHDALDYGDCRLSLALGPKFMKDNGLKHVTFSTADGALEAAPAMGIADAIVDLVSSGTTLRENNLKEIEGGIILESQKVTDPAKGVLDITHEMLERLEAHLKAVGQFTVTANMRGKSAEEVAERILSQPSLSGCSGPTISPVFTKRGGKVAADYFAIVICVPKKALYKSVRQLRAIGGSGVLISPLTYIFDEETPRWRQLLSKLGL